MGCENIKLFSARNKLKVYSGPEIKCNLKSKYSRRKRLGIEYTRYMIGGNSDYLKYFEENKKKDDLADSLLQGLTYLKKIYKLNEIKLI